MAPEVALDDGLEKLRRIELEVHAEGIVGRSKRHVEDCRLAVPRASRGIRRRYVGKNARLRELDVTVAAIGAHRSRQHDPLALEPSPEGMQRDLDDEHWRQVRS